MTDSIDITLWDADAVDELGGKCGQFTSTLEACPLAVHSRDDATITRRLYITTIRRTCTENGCHSESQADVGITFPDSVFVGLYKNCIVWSGSAPL